MKHRLPTFDAKHSARAERHSERARGPAQDWAAPPLERPELPQKVIAVAHVKQPAASGLLAEQLCAEFAKPSKSVAALVTIDTAASAQAAEAIFVRMMEAGARHAKLLRRPEQAVHAAVRNAVAELAEADWIIAWGNVLPQLFKPTFTIVVTGDRRELTQAEPLVLQAQLEVTSPGPELATLLARRLAGEAEGVSVASQ